MCNRNRYGGYHNRPGKNNGHENVQNLNLTGDIMSDAEKVADAIPEKLTMTQLRKIISLTAAILDKTKVVDNDAFAKKIKPALNNLKVQMLYQSGRIFEVKTFVNKAQLINKISEIDNIEKTKNFCHYVEAILGFAKYKNKLGDK